VELKFTGSVDGGPLGIQSASDFWYSDVRVDLVVRVPRGVRVQAGLLEGDVSAAPRLLVKPSAVPSGQ